MATIFSYIVVLAKALNLGLEWVSTLITASMRLIRFFALFALWHIAKDHCLSMKQDCVHSKDSGHR